MMWWVNDDWSWWAWLVMSLGMVAFWALVAWTVVSIVRHTRGPGVRPDAEAILDERFARGEIDEDECRARLTAPGDVGRRPTADPGK